MSAAAPSGSATRPPARVRIATEAHPDRAAHVELEDFDGPLALLLNLVEQRHLDILEVRLATSRRPTSTRIASLDHAQMAHISSFVTVAAQLILIKSRAILPRPPAPAVPVEEGPTRRQRCANGCCSTAASGTPAAP